MIKFGDQAHARHIATAAGVFFNPDCDVCISREEGGRFLGGVLLQNFEQVSIWVTVAGNGNWLSRDLLWVVFHYAFIQLGCRAVFAKILKSNQTSIAFCQKIGFSQVEPIADVFPEDVVILKLLRADCRWLRLTPRALTPRVPHGEEEQGSRAPGLHPDSQCFDEGRGPGERPGPGAVCVG